MARRATAISSRSASSSSSPTRRARDALFERLQDDARADRTATSSSSAAPRAGTPRSRPARCCRSTRCSPRTIRARTSIEDMFASKVAFAALLNFPLTTLAERIERRRELHRRQWAEVRLTGRFDTRVPGELAQAASAAEAAADQYIAGYNLWMHHVLGEDGKRLFPSKKRLITPLEPARRAEGELRRRRRPREAAHDREGDGADRHADDPAAVIDNPQPRLEPVHEQGDRRRGRRPSRPTRPANARPTPSDAREPDTRFEHVRAHFRRRARRSIRTRRSRRRAIERAFDAAEMPEARVRALLVEILESPLAAEAAKEIEQPSSAASSSRSDLWYEFGGAHRSPRPSSTRSRRKSTRPPPAFAEGHARASCATSASRAERAKYLAEHIAVDPSRGAGHAMGAERRGDKAHLRTRVEPGGMDYKGYNIAIHELGHNVEQTFSLYDIDSHAARRRAEHRVHRGARVPVPGARPRAARPARRRPARPSGCACSTTFWNTREIAGSALVELDVWQLALRAPDRDRRRAPRGDREDRAGRLEPATTRRRSAARTPRCSASTATRSRRRCTCSTTCSAT